MTSPNDQEFEAYLPVYDTIPENWEEGREFLVEQLKKISNAVNIRTIGWHLDEELLCGNAFIPGVNNGEGSTSNQQYRSIFRKVIDMSPVASGANSTPHGITVDDRFTLIHLWVSATDPSGLTAATFVAPEVDMDDTNINFTSPQAYDRAFAFVEYTQEL